MVRKIQHTKCIGKKTESSALKSIVSNVFMIKKKNKESKPSI